MSINGAVENNEGRIDHNRGDVLDNSGHVANSWEGTITISGEGTVGTNDGTVIIEIDEEATDEEVEELAKSTVQHNRGEIDVIKSADEIIKYFGVNLYTGGEGVDYLNVSIDSVKENETVTITIPSGYGVDGNIILSKDNTTLALIGEALETNEDGDYIVPVGTTFKVTGSATFIAKIYRIITSTGTVVEVVRDTDTEPSTNYTPTVQKDFTSNIAGIEINSWADVSNVIMTKAVAIEAQPNSDIKLFKLELGKNQLTVPTNVVSSVAGSGVDGLHCFIGNGNAVTFMDNGTLDKYIPTDFTSTSKETATMKTISFANPQEIGATVLFSTKVPVSDKTVSIWLKKDGKYELVGVAQANETGNIAFPISCTGEFVLTY